jgi:hypothetical protein
MLTRLFGRRPTAEVEDAVWIDRAARDAGWTRWVREPATVPTVHVVRSSVDLETTLAALSARRPWRVADGHEAAELPRRLAGPEAVAVALDDRLRASAGSGLALPAFEARVRGRSVRRADDEVLVAALTRLGARRIEFHAALDEPPIAEHAKRLQPLLDRFGMGSDEPIVNGILSRSIERVQR